MIKYKINVLSELKNAGFNTNKIKKEKIISDHTVQNLRENKGVNFETLNALCTLLSCQPGDILEFVPDGSETRETE